jgi:5'-nucleotidase
MDGVLVDFNSAILRGRGYANEHLDPNIIQEYKGRLEQVPGIFSLMVPMPDAIESYLKLTQHFDTYILSTFPWENHSAANDKLEWVKKYLGESAYKRLILTHHKNLTIGDYLIDDRTDCGIDRFIGEHIHFGSKKFPNWRSVLKYLLDS